MSHQTFFNFVDSEATESLRHAPSGFGDIARPIHYLGSKLRIVHLVQEVLDEIDPLRGPVCDLFAGSGTVARGLSRSRKVISVDIQEYSRVLCSALLNP